MYWRNPFRPLATAKQLVEYVVLDIEPLGPESQKHALAEVQVRCRSVLAALFTAYKQTLGICETGLSLSDWHKLAMRLAEFLAKQSGSRSGA